MVLTVASVTITASLRYLTAFVIQRRRTRVAAFVSGLFLAGLIILRLSCRRSSCSRDRPVQDPARLVLVEVAFLMPFAVLVFRAFVSAIPRELDEAAIIDGATPLTLFFRVIFPLLRPAVITVIVVRPSPSTTTSSTRCTSCPATRTPPSS